MIRKQGNGTRTNDLMHEHRGALFDARMPKCIIRRVARAVEYMEGGERVYGSRCSRWVGRARSGGLQERMDARMFCGPSAVAEDSARDEAGKEAGGERRAEGLPGQGTLVLCEATEGIVPGRNRGIMGGLWGKSRGPPKTIGGSGKARGLAVLFEGTRMTIDELVARGVDETARGGKSVRGMWKVHGRGCDERRVWWPDE
jgi:hypothetical protein